MTQLSFTNPAPARLTPADLATAAHAHGLTPAHLAAIASVEGSGTGYLADGRPKILLEAHIFSRLTGHRYDISHPPVSSKSWNRSLYKGGAAEYGRLQIAMSLDDSAALMSCSWGLFQILGENYAMLGYPSVQHFVVDIVSGGEPAHLAAVIRFISVNGLIEALRKSDWRAFARGYNGPGQVDAYASRLAAAYAKHEGSAA